MDFRLGVNHYFYIFRLEAEKPAGLDHLKSLIHQRGRIDGDTRSHLPGWMIQSLFRRHEGEFRGRRLPKRTARGCENELGHVLAAPGAETLMRAVVLAIHRNQLRTGDTHRVHHQSAAGNQDLFISETDAFSEANGFISRLQTLHSD